MFSFFLSTNHSMSPSPGLNSWSNTYFSKSPNLNLTSNHLAYSFIPQFLIFNHLYLYCHSCLLSSKSNNILISNTHSHTHYHNLVPFLLIHTSSYYFNPHIPIPIFYIHAHTMLFHICYKTLS